MSLSRFVCVNAWLISQPPASPSAGGRRSAHTAPRPRERRARASPCFSRESKTYLVVLYAYRYIAIGYSRVL